MNTMGEDIFEVNIDDILYQLIHKFRIILLAGVVCAVSAFVFMEFFHTPVYTSSTSILIDVPGVELNDEYPALVFSNEVLDSTLEYLKLDCSSDTLKGKINASIQANARILHISAADPDPEMAKWIADTVRECTINLIRTSRGIDSIRVLNEANIPRYPTGISTKKMTVFAGAAGIAVAICIIIMMTLLRGTICTPEEVRRYTGLDTLGIIPIESGMYSSTGGTVEQTYVLEAYNALRANLLFCGENFRTIAMVSCTSGEGTTSMIRRVAPALADIGKKVLVINANMHRQMDSDILQAETTGKGLCEYLSGICTIDECVFSTSCEHLYVLSSGASVDNPAELLSRDQLSILFKSLRDVYDYILVDCPSLSSTIDSAIIAKVCDASIIVLESDKVKLRLVQSVKEQLEKADALILGVILNKFNVKRYKCYGNYFESSDSKSD